MSLGDGSLWRGRSLAALVTGGVLAALASMAAPAPAAIELATEPSLVPAFSPRVSDYAVRCEQGARSVEVRSGSGARVAIDGSGWRSGSFRRDVALDPGQRFEIGIRRSLRRRTGNVRCLPEDYPAYQYTRERRPARSLYATAPKIPIDDGLPGYAALIDDRGTPLWWHRGEGASLPGDLRVLSDGRIAFIDAPLPGHPASQDGYQVRGHDGTLERVVGTLGSPTDPRSPGIFGGQHDARLLRPGILTVHDNGSKRDYGPRAVRFEIDEEAGTARLLESVTDPAAPASFCCGSARRIDGGYWVLGWGGVNFSTEFDPEGRRTFRLDTPGLFSYRTVPVEAGLVSDRQLRVGMDAQYPRQPRECGGELSAGPAGTLGPDRIGGGSGDEFIDGLAGDDRLKGRRGRDCLLGSSGVDRIVGGRGGDRLNGGPGADILRCGRGRDTAVVVGRDTVASGCERILRR